MHMFIAQPVAPPTGFTSGVHLASDWNTIWGDFKSATGFSTFQWVLTIVGLGLVLSAILAYVWQRRSGQQGGHRRVFESLFVGAVFLMPGTLIPLFLTIADVIINTIVSIAK